MFKAVVVLSFVIALTCSSCHAARLRLKKPFAPSDQELVVSPKHKLVFCPIAKNANTQFNAMVDVINNGEADEFHWSIYERNTVRTLGLDPKDLTAKNGWKWAVFLREPVERYLSSFTSKCLAQEDGGNYCLPISSLVSEKAPINEQVAAFESGVRVNVHNVSGLDLDPHWAEQSIHCGGLNDLKGYDFVGHLDGDVNGQVRSMLRMAHINETIADKFFPKNRIASVRDSHTTNARDMVDTFYRNVSIIATVKQMYSNDLRLYYGH